MDFCNYILRKRQKTNAHLDLLEPAKKEREKMILCREMKEVMKRRNEDALKT